MKKFFTFLGVIVLLLIIVGGIYFFKNNEPLPTGIQGKEADALAEKMLVALNNEAYKNTEIIEWSFRGDHFYKWDKKNNIVDIKWDTNNVILHTDQPEKSDVFVDGEKVENPKLIEKATKLFNNDSFWLVAPYKVFDNGTERRLVKYNEKDALLITYTSGGSTPGDSYLWILDEKNLPKSYKMWTKIIPIGGVKASWEDWIHTDSGIQLPTKHSLSLFGMELDMGTVKAYNPKADELANEILKAIKHDAYKNTKNLEWSFGGRRFYKWNKKDHSVEVVWDTTKVMLHPNNPEKSIVYFNNKISSQENNKTIKKATDLFNNDSFWLVAPHKLFEPGIIRNIERIDNKDALKVTYTKGGTTPGDSYVWILDENYIPKSYRMYVPSMKMEGVPSTWEDWITTQSGTLLPTIHSFGSGRKLSMGNVKGYN